MLPDINGFADINILQNDCSEDEACVERKLKAKLKNQMGVLGLRAAHIRSDAAQDPVLKRLTVTVLHGRNLPIVDPGGRRDPLIQVTLGSQSVMTQVEWQTSSPEWNETFEFAWDPLDAKKLSISALQSYSSGNRPIGHGTVDLRMLSLDVPVEQWVALEGGQGEVLLKVLYDDPAAPAARSPVVTFDDIPMAPMLPSFGYEPHSPPRTKAYKAVEVAPENVPEDPWMVLEPNHLYLSDDDIQLREKMLDAVYPEWDLDGSGRVELNEIKQICVSFVGCNIESTHLDMLNRLGTLVTAQRIPEEGYARDILIPFVIRLTNSFSEVEFERFMEHIVETNQLLAEITEQGRRSKAFWRIFKMWDTNRNLTVDTNQMEHILLATDYGRINRTRIEEMLAEQRSHQQDKQGMDDVTVSDFQKFMHTLLEGVTEMEMNHVLAQIRTAMREAPLELPHAVWRNMYANKKRFGGDRPTGEIPDETEMARLMYQLQSDARHAFDSLTLEDIESDLNERTPSEHYKIVATPICLMFGVGPAEHIKTRQLSYWEGLKKFIVDDPRRFLHFLQNFEARRMPYEMVQKIMRFHYHELSDPNTLLLVSNFLSCLCQWCESTVRLCCMIQDWEYPPPARHEQELMHPTNHGLRADSDPTPGYLRAYPPPVCLGIDKPPKSMLYLLPHWAIVKDWTGAQNHGLVNNPLFSGRPQAASGYQGAAPRQRTVPCPATCLAESGACHRLTDMLDQRRLEHEAKADGQSSFLASLSFYKRPHAISGSFRLRNAPLGAKG